jgi:hypothetical protein
MASKTFKSGSISMGIASNDALSWRGSIGTEIKPNNEGKIVSEKGVRSARWK